MAIVQCIECGSEISDQAKTCPHCVKPMPKKSGGCLPALVTLIAVGVLAFIILGSMHGQSGSSSARQPYTGRLRIDSGTEYVMEESPSPLPGACTGWNAVSVQKPGSPAGGMRDLMCWKRSGSNIQTQDRYGGHQESVPESVISD